LPAKDNHHDCVKRALVKDGWIITHEPRTILLPERFLYIDLRAERDSGEVVVLIEIKGFERRSQIEALAEALGKYNLYRSALQLSAIHEPLYLAIPQGAYDGIVSETLGRKIIEDYAVKLLIFDPDVEEIVRWMP
jgi:hypothetical protein